MRIQRIEEAQARRRLEDAERRSKIKADEKARREAYRIALANGEIEEDPIEKERREQEYSNAYLLADESSEEEGSEWAEIGGKVRRGRRRRNGKRKSARIIETTQMESDPEGEDDDGLNESVGALRVAVEEKERRRRRRRRRGSIATFARRNFSLIRSSRNISRQKLIDAPKKKEIRGMPKAVVRAK